MKKLFAVVALVFTIGAFAPVDADAGRYYRSFCGTRPAVHVHGPGCGHWVSTRPVYVRPAVHTHYWGCGCPGWGWARPYYRPYICL